MILAAIKAPNTAANRRFLDEWQSYEGGTAKFNPLNTTQKVKGSTRYNSAGVQNYPTAAAGTTATRITLENGRYPDILKALRSGSPFTYQPLSAVEAQIETWGTFAFAQALASQTAPVQPGSTSGTDTSQLAPSGHSGFADLRNSVNKHLPTQLEQSRRTGLATLSFLSLRTKVRH